MKWIGAALAVVALWFGAWIWLPAPTYFLLTFSVGSPEVSHWLILLSVAAIALLWRDARRHSKIALIALWTSVVALFLALTVWVRVPGTIRRFDAATRNMRATPSHPLRSAPVRFVDLFRPIPRGPLAVTTTRGIVFKSFGGATRPLTMTIYQPAVADTYPIVVQIYGGAWQRGNPDLFANFATWLASSGYVVIAIDYRHAPESRWPAQLDDVESAMSWIWTHAGEYGGDRSRIVMLGRSAGAHLATYAAWFSTPMKIRGVVSFYGPADLITSYVHPPVPDPLGVRHDEEALLGGTLAEMPERYVAASTITHLAPGVGPPPPPTLLIYGRRDNIVEAKYGAVLARALRNAGGQVAYLEIPWASHAFDEVFDGPSSQLSLYYIERFIAWAVR